MYDDDPTEEQPAAEHSAAGEPAAGQPGTVRGPAAPSASGAAAQSADRPLSRRAGAVGAAMASGTAGWMVAAALGGSLVTLLLTGQLHSSQPAYFRPTAAQQPAGPGRLPAARARRVEVPAPAPAGAGARQVPAPYGPGQVQAPVGPGRVVYGRSGVTVVLPPRAFIGAVPGPGQMFLPPGAMRHWFSALPPRAFIGAVPGQGQMFLPPGAMRGRTQVLPLPAAACRLGARAWMAPTPKRARFWARSGRRTPVRSAQVPAGRHVIFLPGFRQGGPHSVRLRVITIKGQRVMIGLIAPSRPWTASPACLSWLPRTNRP